MSLGPAGAGPPATRAPLTSREREHVLEALEAVQAGEGRAFASSVIAEIFRRERGLRPHVRGRIADAVYGVLRRQRRLDAIVEALGVDGDRPSRTSGQAAAAAARERALLVWELREGAEPEPVLRALARSLGREVDAANVLDPDAGLAGATGVEREAIRHSLPTWLLQRMIEDLGEGEAVALAAALAERPPTSLRANTLRGSRDELIERLAEAGIEARPGVLARDAVALPVGGDLFSLDAFHAGLFEQMDEGSQLVVETTAPPPRGDVLDACAGAGGKTLALAAWLGGRGRVLALDPSREHVAALRKRARRAGASNVQALELATTDASLPDAAVPGRGGPARGWDRVLVDAPCSGSGVLRRNPEARWRLREEDVDAFAARQLAILERFAPLVAEGGRLVYATCSVLACENDAVVDAFLSAHPEFVKVSLKEIVGRARAEAIGDGERLRLWPHRHGCDGFFAAVLRRTRAAADERMAARRARA